jgi:hypothetical protein
MRSTLENSPVSRIFDSFAWQSSCSSLLPTDSPLASSVSTGDHEPDQSEERKSRNIISLPAILADLESVFRRRRRPDLPLQVAERKTRPPFRPDRPGGDRLVSTPVDDEPLKALRDEFADIDSTARALRNGLGGGGPLTGRRDGFSSGTDLPRRLARRPHERTFREAPRRGVDRGPDVHRNHARRLPRVSGRRTDRGQTRNA